MFNAVNEEAVDLFIGEEIGFYGVSGMIAEGLEGLMKI